MTKNNTEVPAGYKSSELGVIPEGWQVKRLGEICKTFKSGQSITSQNITDDGLYPVYGGNGLRGFTHSYTHSGSYVLIGRQGALCGNVNYVEGDTYISEHAIAVQTDDNCYLQWLKYKLDFWNLNRFSESSAQPGLSVEKLVRYKLSVPSLGEQERITEILGTWDRAIELQGQKVALLQSRKRGLMQQLLTTHRRLPNFSTTWETVELGELLSYEQPTPYIVKSTEYDDKYSIPVLTAGKTFILGYTNETIGVFRKVPVIIFDDFTTASKFVNFPFKAKSSAMKILSAKAGIDINFVFGAMQHLKYVVGGHERHWISKFAYLTINIPSLGEQRAIAEVLTAADREIELATQNLTALRSQKRALMQQLLTGKKQVQYETTTENNVKE